MEHEHTWVLTETGFTRTWSTTVDEETRSIRAVSNGLTDFSADGDKMDLQCDCGATREVDDMRIDFY